ncbi:precorrin-6y C5,15-methyltransferase (decarboxylating) subunit CbiE [Oryzihumus sp.]
MDGAGGGTVAVVGIGADGWAGLTSPAREALRSAGVVLGGHRQLDLLPAEVPARRVAWPTPLRPALAEIVAEHRAAGLVVIASGDPMWFGIGRALVEELGSETVHVLPHPSSISLACARLGWPVEDATVVSAVGRPVAGVARELYDGVRLLVLSADASTPEAVADLLRDRGFGASELVVLEQLGSASERRVEGVAATWVAAAGAALNVVAVRCRRSPEGASGPRLSLVPGLPDEAYEHDGQLTKREVRAVTLAALAPAPGELLWDVGGGSGSIAIEWMRSHRTCRAVSVEGRPDRAARITGNAARLGVPGLRVVTGVAPAALDGLPAPDAVFVGGGLTTPGLLEACWSALRPGGRLVANTVTLESEALLARWHATHGGDLTRVGVAHAVPVGGFTGWRAAMPVTQWSVVKPEAFSAHGAQDAAEVAR